MSKLICKNYGSCSKADARESIELMVGVEPICEECGFKLASTEPAGDQKSRKKLVVSAVIGVVVIGAGLVTYLSSSSTPGKTAASVAAPQPTGLSPGEKALALQKGEADKKIIEAGGAGAATGQKVVIAKEYVKAAIPLMQAGKWREAEEQLLKAKGENPDEPLVYYNLAITHLKQLQSKEALAALETAFNKGFKEFSALEADADLKPLTSKREYAALAARFKGK